MQIKFLATGISPGCYEFDLENDIVTAYKDEQEESFDLSNIEYGDEFGEYNEDGEWIHGCQPETLDIPGTQIIRDAYRDKNGELFLTLCQEAGSGDWKGKYEYMNAEDYDKDTLYIERVD